MKGKKNLVHILFHPFWEIAIRTKIQKLKNYFAKINIPYAQKNPYNIKSKQTRVFVFGTKLDQTWVIRLALLEAFKGQRESETLLIFF